MFSFQFLQIVQLSSTLAVQLGFTFLTLKYSRKYKFFESCYVYYTRNFQEISMTIIISVFIVIFCDNSFKFMDVSGRNVLTLGFLFLVTLNILLEVIGAFVQLGVFIYESCKKRRNKKKSKLKIVNKSEI